MWLSDVDIQPRPLRRSESLREAAGESAAVFCLLNYLESCYFPLLRTAQAARSKIFLVGCKFQFQIEIISSGLADLLL